MLQRWAKLEKVCIDNYDDLHVYSWLPVAIIIVQDFKLSDGQFDISKIPDIYDCIKYDLLHNG